MTEQSEDLVSSSDDEEGEESDITERLPQVIEFNSEDAIFEESDEAPPLPAAPSSPPQVPQPPATEAALEEPVDPPVEQPPPIRDGTETIKFGIPDHHDYETDRIKVPEREESGEMPMLLVEPAGDSDPSSPSELQQAYECLELRTPIQEFDTYARARLETLIRLGDTERAATTAAALELGLQALRGVIAGGGQRRAP